MHEPGTSVVSEDDKRRRRYMHVLLEGLFEVNVIIL